MEINIGDKIKILDQDITGMVIEKYDGKVVIEDDDAETNDNRLEFKLTEIERKID